MDNKTSTIIKISIFVFLIIIIVDFVFAIAPKYFEEKADKQYKEEEFNKAITSYSNSLFLNSTSKKALLKRGWAYFKLREFEKAIKDGKNAIKAGDSTYEPFDLIAISYVSLKDYKNALIYLNKYLKIKPDNPKIILNQGFVYLYLSSNQTKDKEKEYLNSALKSFEKLLKIDPSNYTGLLYKSRAYFVLKEYKKSLKSLKRALKVNPNSTEALFDKCQLYFHMKKYSRAYKDLKKYIKVQPNDTRAKNLLNILKSKRKKRSKISKIDSTASKKSSILSIKEFKSRTFNLVHKVSSLKANVKELKTGEDIVDNKKSMLNVLSNYTKLKEEFKILEESANYINRNNNSKKNKLHLVNQLIKEVKFQLKDINAKILDL